MRPRLPAGALALASLLLLATAGAQPAAPPPRRATASLPHFNAVVSCSPVTLLVAPSNSSAGSSVSLQAEPDAAAAVALQVVRRAAPRRAGSCCRSCALCSGRISCPRGAGVGAHAPVASPPQTTRPPPRPSSTHTMHTHSYSTGRLHALCVPERRLLQPPAAAPDSAHPGCGAHTRRGARLRHRCVTGSSLQLLSSTAVLCAHTQITYTHTNRAQLCWVAASMPPAPCRSLHLARASWWQEG